MLKLRNPPTSTLDANLFLARHLLILKEIAQNLDLVQRDIEPRIDFGGVTGTSSPSRSSKVIECANPINYRYTGIYVEQNNISPTRRTFCDTRHASSW